MLDTTQSFLRHCPPQYRAGQGEGKLYQLRKCKRQVLSEYDRSFHAYSEEEKEMKKVNSALEETISKLKNEKNQLEKSLQGALVQQEKAVWDKVGLEKVLRQQQEQISIYEGQKEEREEGQNLFRRENLLQLKERDATIQSKLNTQSTQTAISQQCRTLEGQILNAMKSIQAKTETNQQCSDRLQALEKGSMKAIQNVNQLDDKIEANTLAIEKKLTVQGVLANRYGELKRNKKYLQTKINEIARELEQEKEITGELMEVQENLNETLCQIHKEIQVEHSQIARLKSENTCQKKEAATNKECLIKLQVYLASLKNENEKIELYMERVLEEDQRVKAAIDRKHSRTPWRSPEDKSMGSTFA